MIAASPGLGFVLFINLVLLVLIVYVIAKVVGTRRYKRQPNPRTFSATPAEIIHEASRIAAALGYSIESTESNVLVLKTGFSRYSWRGQTMEVRAEVGSDNKSTVAIRGQRNPSFQVYDWGEPDRIAARLFSGLEARFIG